MPTDLLTEASRKCVEIHEADNGYILVIKGQGKSIFKTKYTTPVAVYGSLDVLVEELAEIFEETE